MPLGASTRRLFGFPLTLFVIGALATALVTLQMRRGVAAQDAERFEIAVDQLQDSVSDRLDLYVAMLRAGAGLIDAADLRSPGQFKAFVDRLEMASRYPGVQGIGYTERIAPADLDAVVAAQRKSGRPDFHVWPEGPRPEYQSIIYLEPMDRRNTAAIGYDMFTEPTRRAAMERARDTGQPAASGLVTLVQEIDEVKQPGFLIYMPVYRGGSTPSTVEERRRQLRGFVYSPFRAADLFTGILGHNPRPRAGVALFDGTPESGSLIYQTDVERGTGRLQEMRTIDVAGRRWTAEVFSTAALDRSSTGQLTPLVAWGGSAITLLLTAFAVLQVRARERAERSEAAAGEASRRFQHLANSIPQLAWMARPDGWIYWFNDRWYEYTGTTADQVTGWSWQRLHDPDILPAVVARWKHSLSHGEPFEMEYPLRGADGRYRFFLTRIVPFRDDDGSVVQWFGTSTDVQYRRDAERSLREQADTLEILNETGAQLAAELDLDRLVQRVTDAATKLTRAQIGAFFFNEVNEGGESYTLYSLSGVPRSAFEQLPMPRKTALFAPTFHGEAVVRSGDISADPRYGRNAPYDGIPEGHPPVRSYLAVPVRSRSGDVLGGLFFGHSARDVFTAQSEQIAAGIAAQAAVAIDNARLYGQVQSLLSSERTARTEAERVSRTKDEFLATLSHELRTPLNAIVGWAHMLSSGMLSDAKRQTAVDTILRNARVQSQLIEDLLDMSRIISGRVRIDAAEVNVADVVNAALDVVRPTASARRIELTLHSSQGPHMVSGDNARLQQIVWNLLTNAIKFTPAGGRVDVAIGCRDDQVEVRVSDTGIGIAPDFLPHVFERFRQADGSMTRGHGGLGLGLSIVKNLVEMHGGTIHAASDGPGRGATFTLSLPAITAAVSPAAFAHHLQGGSPDSQTLHGLSILVVDDDADAGELAGEILSQSGARVTIARSAADALRQLDRDGARIQLIVSDLGMPHVDGYEFMRRVRALPPEAGGSIPAIALTAYAGADDRTRAMAAGFDLHLAKPFAPGHLISACAALVGTGSA